MSDAYALTHEPVLRRVLQRLGFWPNPDQPLPEPVEVRTGVAGHSAVYLLYLATGPDTGRYLAAKFDLPERSRREWQVVEELRCMDSPREILLPLPGNVPADGVMVFQAAGAVAGANLTCMTLGRYLTQQFAGNLQNCRTAFTKTFEVLGAYYDIAPGAHRLALESGLLRWDRIFGDQLSDTVIQDAQAAAMLHWPGVDWLTSPTFSLPGSGGITPRSLPNPFSRLRPLLREVTGSVMLSRIHGDLNLSNLIVARRADASVDRVLVIDLANSEPNRVQAVDFARIEVEIWRQFDTNETELLAARDVLDGRIAETSADLSATIHSRLLLVDHLRELAYDRLAPRPPGTYLLADYMHALYFTSLASLKYRDVAGSRECTRTMLLSAALALAYLDEVDHGLYAPGAVVDRLPPPRHLIKSKRVESPERPPVATLVPPAPLSQLPGPPSDFTGRQLELRRLRDALRALDGRPASVGLFGTGGVGKTSLALTLAAEVASHYPDGQIFLDLGGLTVPLSVSQVMAYVIRSFFPRAQLSDQESELAALYHHVLHDKQVLLLLDNAVGPDQVAPLVLATGSLVIVTSQFHFALPGLVPFPLAELPRRDARSLLLRICPRIGRTAGTLAALCGDLPLSLRVVGSIMQLRPDLAPQIYASQLAKGRERLEPVSLAKTKLRVTKMASLATLLSGAPGNRLGPRSPGKAGELVGFARRPPTPSSRRLRAAFSFSPTRSMEITWASSPVISHEVTRIGIRVAASPVGSRAKAEAHSA